MKVILVGIGMGNPQTATVAAVEVIAASDLLIGGARMLESFPEARGKRLALTRADDIVAALDEAQSDSSIAQACILLSGDVGFYSGATSLYQRLSAYEVEVVPGISSLNYLCAKVHTPWQDAFLVSAHGRAHNAVGAIQSHEKTFVITGGATKAHDICAALQERDMGDVRIIVGENLSYTHERIVEGTAAALAAEHFDDLAVLLALNEHPIVRAYTAPSLTDDDFERTKVPMTKEEVRAVIVSKMHVAAASTVWDVGAGTGSVSIELALSCPQGRVFAIERNAEACALIERNKQKLGAGNVAVIEGEAPKALADLPQPDCVFVGGSAGNLEAIVNAALDANPQVRIVVSAITLETVAEALHAFAACGLPTDDIVQLSVARARTAGDYHLMMGQNPVFVISGQVRASE